jgi:hypothetical protein
MPSRLSFAPLFLNRSFRSDISIFRQEYRSVCPALNRAHFFSILEDFRNPFGHDSTYSVWVTIFKVTRS